MTVTTTSAFQYLKKTYQAVTHAKSLHMYYVHSYTCAELCASAPTQSAQWVFQCVNYKSQLQQGTDHPSPPDLN